MIKLVYPTIGEAEITNVVTVLRSHHLERGNVTLLLEQQVENYFNSRYAVVTSNGTAALFAGLKACGISKGDEVITTPFSFIATINAILLCGAKPVFVDIDPNTFNIDTSKIEGKVTKRTKAILAVDLYGCPAEYDELRKLANKHKFLLISDNCQAIGALYHNKPINRFAHVTICSFFNSKNITSGEGGVLLTSNKSIEKRVNSLINHGQKRGIKYNYLDVGWNFRPTDIQSAIIIIQLKRLKQINDKRNKNAEYLIKHLSSVKGLILPSIKPHLLHSFSRFTIRVTDKFSLSRDQLKQYLHNNEIESEVAYPKPLYKYPHVRQYKQSRFPIVENVAKQVLSLPIHQNLSQKELDCIIQTIKRAS